MSDPDDDLDPGTLEAVLTLEDAATLTDQPDGEEGGPDA